MRWAGPGAAGESPVWTDTERDLIRDEIDAQLDGLDHYVDFVDDVDIVAVWSVGRLPTGRITMLDKAGLWLCERPERMSSSRDGIQYTISYKFRTGRRALEEMQKVSASAGLDDLDLGGNLGDDVDDPSADPDDSRSGYGGGGGLAAGLDFNDVELCIGRRGGDDLDFSGLDDPDPDPDPEPKSGEPDGMDILASKGRLSW